MWITRLTGLLIAVAVVAVHTQAPRPSPAAGSAFDVVSIKRNTAGALARANGSNERPDGGFTLRNVLTSVLISRAYPPAVPVDIIGLPEWATTPRGDRYDVVATSSLSRPATTDERIAMLRAMLADRFKLVARIEQREQPVFDLVVARKDGHLGPGIKPSEFDCAARAAAEAGSPPPRLTVADLTAPPAPCRPRIFGEQLEGDLTMERLAGMLRQAADRYIVDKTGLAGYYRVTMTFDSMPGLRRLDATPEADRAPSVFTAVQEQLGLKLESSRALRETLVIDHLERPTEN